MFANQNYFWKLPFGLWKTNILQHDIPFKDSAEA